MAKKNAVPPVRQQLRKRIRKLLDTDEQSEFTAILEDVLSGLDDLDEGAHRVQAVNRHCCGADK